MKEYIFERPDEAEDTAKRDAYCRGELIRCKDCRYYRGDHEYCVNDMFAIENGFCNWAERKEE